jgi:hypothetical protein
VKRVLDFHSANAEDAQSSISTAQSGEFIVSPAKKMSHSQPTLRVPSSGKFIVSPAKKMSHSQPTLRVPSSGKFVVSPVKNMPNSQPNDSRAKQPNCSSFPTEKFPLPIEGKLNNLLIK